MSIYYQNGLQKYKSVLLYMYGKRCVYMGGGVYVYMGTQAYIFGMKETQ